MSPRCTTLRSGPPPGKAAPKSCRENVVLAGCFEVVMHSERRHPLPVAGCLNPCRGKAHGLGRLGMLALLCGDPLTPGALQLGAWRLVCLL